MCFKKVSVVVGIIHRIDMVIWVFKAGWVHFWSMTINYILRKSSVECISVFVELFRS